MQYQVEKITYKWNKYTREIRNRQKWKVYRKYKTLQAAQNALKDLRNSPYDKLLYDYPAMDKEIENEKKYPYILPTITINRYKITEHENN